MSDSTISNELLSLDKLIDGLIQKFNPNNANNININYKFIFDGNDAIYIEVKDNVAKLLSDAPSHIDTTIKTTHEVWQKISFNELSGQDALLDGLVTCEGSMKNFALMPKLFDRELPKESDSEEYSQNNSNKKSETNNKKETFNEDLSKPKAINKNKELMPINTIMNGMVAGFEPSKAKNLHIKYKFSFDDHEPIYLEIKNNTAKLHKSLSNVDTTIITSHETWYKIAFNEISGEDALMDGLVKCEGKLKNFALLPELFNTSDDEDEKEDSRNIVKLNPVIWVSLSLVPWIFYWATSHTFSSLIISSFAVVYTTLFITLLKPPSSKNITKLEAATLFAFPLYHLFSVINPVIFNYEISALFLNGILILTLLISSFTKSSVMGEYSKLSFDPYITKTKLFKIINKNLTLVWSLIFTIRFLMEFFIPRPLNNLAYIFIVIGIIVSYKYPKKKMGH